MNIREIETVIRIAEEQNISKAAEKMFLTPSALLQQLTRIEKDVGAPLFYRSRTGCSITAAGEIYLEAAQKMVRLRGETYSRIRDMENIRRGTLSVGLPPEHGPEMFLSVYPVFHEMYPEMNISMFEVGTRTQLEMISQGKIDLGFMNVMESQMTGNEYQVLFTEELMLVLPSSHRACGESRPAPGCLLPELSLSHLNQETFVLPSRASTLRQWIDEQMEQAGCVPNVLFENTRGRTMLSMVSKGMCCGMASDFYYHPELEHVSYYYLPNHPTWYFAACYHKDSYLSTPAKEFIRLATAYWKEDRLRRQTTKEETSDETGAGGLF